MMPSKNMLLGLLKKLHDPSRDELDRAVGQLRSLNREATMQVLRDLLSQPDLNLCCDAAEAIMRIDSKAGIDLILPLLNHQDGTVRWYACGLLYDRGDGRATAHLLHVLLNDPESDVRLIAANALGRISDPSAIPSLQHAAETDQGEDYEGRTVADAARDAIQEISSRSTR